MLQFRRILQRRPNEFVVLQPHEETVAIMDLRPIIVGLRFGILAKPKHAGQGRDAERHMIGWPFSQEQHPIYINDCVLARPKKEIISAGTTGAFEKSVETQ